jgi:hypothetical protein
MAYESFDNINQLELQAAIEVLHGSYYRIPKNFFGIRLKCFGFTE